MLIFLWILNFCLRSTIAGDDGGQAGRIQFYDLPSQVCVNESIGVRVHYRRHPQAWDLYLQQDGEDVGPPLKHVKKHDEDHGFNVSITTIGDNLTLVAKSDQSIIGSSNSFDCSQQTPLNGIPTFPETSGAISSQSSGSGSLSATSRIVANSESTPDSAIQQPSHPLIVGLTIGIPAIIIGFLLVFLFIRRRRRLANEVPRHVIFNRELMFERRPTYDDWSLHSVELEKAVAAVEVPKVYITKTTHSDRNV